ncbi:Dna2 [Kluyveromyces lactis]|nr:Dna2 [Kluyveromyces lactis]
MVSTPKKKRTASVSISPFKKDTDAISVDYKGKPKKKSSKPYHFAPLNRLSSEEPILKSIPISRVRNVEAGSSVKDTVKAKTSGKTKLASKRIINSTKTRREKSTEAVPETRYSDGPSEEVIWRYSPRKIDEQLYNHYNTGNDDDNSDQLSQDMPLGQSSTPLINDKFKDVIDFENMDPNCIDKVCKKIAQGSPVKRGEKDVTPMRDIHEILNDLEGPKLLPPSSPICSEPVVIDDDPVENLPELESESISNHKHTTTNGIEPTFTMHPPQINIDDDEDEDDSLIDILTQRFTKPVITECNEESEESDASLLELLDEEKPVPLPQPQVRKIERIEVMLESEDENVEDFVKSNENQTDHLRDNTADVVERYANLAKFPFPQRGFQRLCIFEIKEMKSPAQIILTCFNQDAGKVNLILRDPWIRFRYEQGMIIHLIEGDHFPNKRLLSNDKDPKTGLENDNLLIVYPDVLLSATTIGTAMDCERRAVLSSKFNEPGEYSLAAVLGNIIHALVQEVLRLKLLEPNQFLSKGLALEILDKVIKPFTTEVNMCGESVESVIKTISDEHLPFIIEFVNIYVTKDNSRSWIQVIGTKNKRKLSVSQIVDIEENIWSSKYGLKGYIDVTVETNVDSDGKKLLAPVEIKTGKWKSNAHEAQGLIYTLLLQDRYDIPVNLHMMLYTKLREFSLQPKVLISLKHLLNLRNKLATYLQVMNEEMSDWGGPQHELPAMIQNSKCDQCFMKTSCMVLNKLSDKEQTPGLLKHDYTDLTRHLEAQGSQVLELFRSFYSKYDRLLMMEETSITSVTKDTFLMSSTDREAQTGHCISQLTIKNVQDQGNGRYLYTFCRESDIQGSFAAPNAEQHETNKLKGVPTSMLSSDIHKGDYIMISNDTSGQLAIGTGHVSEIANDFIVINCARNILANNIHGDSFDRNTRQVVRSVLLKQKEPLNEKQSLTSGHRYRIDKNESATGLTLARYNLLNLFLPEVLIEPELSPQKSGEKVQLPVKRSLGGYSRGRRLIVELSEPKWTTHVARIPTLNDSFNENQKMAIERSLTCRDYNLILGMPGTGKTSVICELVSILVSQGKSVMVTSYTNSAVDNIIMKLTSRIPRSKMVRLGSRRRVHDLVKPYCITELLDGDNENLSEIIDAAQVVGVTCLGINDPWLQMRNGDFDYVILDEASQVSLPVAIGPLRFGYKFILVGDHYQLPPLVKNPFARDNGLQESLFEKLCHSHPQSVVELQLQYRMNAEIMSLSNVLIYGGKLQCGTDEIRKQVLQFPNNYKCSQDTWLQKAINPEQPVVILDHDGFQSTSNDQFVEQNDHGQLSNVGEANVVNEVVRELLAHGIEVDQIGVMSMYKAQMSLLKTTLEDLDIDVLTADQFQGRDKDCIIISMVRSNPDQASGVLLRDLRRMNVAVSRAKKKLIIICSWKCISKIHPLKPFVDHVARNNWITKM